MRHFVDNIIDDFEEEEISISVEISSVFAFLFHQLGRYHPRSDLAGPCSPLHWRCTHTYVFSGSDSTGHALAYPSVLQFVVNGPCRAVSYHGAAMALQSLVVRNTIHMKGGSEKGYPPFFMRKTLSRKLYMTNRTAHQTTTINFCVLGLAILGTLRAREMVAKERMPSRPS